MTDTSRMNKTILTTAILAALTVLPSVQAQTESQDNETETAADLDDLVVIGTRSETRTVFDTPVPVDVIDERVLQSTGAVAGELGQALATVAPSFFFPRQSNSGSSDLVRAGQLRGLSPDQLLVLVNGKRRHTSAIVNSETKIGRGTAAVDFNTIPLNAISRVEILRDGAGAQYGSDAIAGVINIVLDRSAGLDLSAGYGQHDTDLDPINRSITDGETITADIKYGWALAEDGFFKLGLSLRDRDGTNRAGFDTIPFFEAQTPANLALRGQRNYAIGDPDVEEINAWFNTEISLGDGTLYGFGTLADRESTGGAAFFRYPDSFSNVPDIYPQGFRPETRGDDLDLAGTVGWRQYISDWSLDSSVTYGRNRFEFGVDESLNASLGPASPTSFDSGTFRLEQLTVNVDGVRSLNWSRPASLAIGAEFRHEDYATRAGDEASFIAGPFDGAIGAQAAPGLTPDDEQDVSRDVFSLYADLGVDLTDRLFVNAAARAEDYDDFGSALTGKLSARFALTDELALRAAVSNSFRAPNLAQVGFSDTTLNFGDNRTLIRTRTLPVNDPIARSLGATDLSEEKSNNFSVGFIGQYDRFNFSVDAFRIEIDDRITLSERLFGQAIEDFVQAQPGGESVQSVRFFTNAVDTTTTGVDVTMGYETPFAGGDLTLTAVASYAKTDIDSIRGTTDELTALDPSLTLVGVEEINTLEDAAPRSKGIVTADWQGQRLNLLTRLSRYGSATRVFNFGGGFEPEQTYGAEFQLDFEGSYQVTDSTRLTLGVVNLLDEYPDLSSSDINFFGNLPYDVLSPIGVNGRYVYGRVNFSFEDSGLA
ncbi:MAG: TonB-dependent receptor, partial [Pseudomonadota bacterium]